MIRLVRGGKHVDGSEHMVSLPVVIPSTIRARGQRYEHCMVKLRR